ncbi:MAG: hypothetical protein OWU33_15235 [Firmicutes bacterium]|nr:hypothetical protein [Bacillota bacterium]
MAQREPLLDRQNAFGKVDLTPWECVRALRQQEREAMTKDELIHTVQAQTGESSSTVRFRIQNWARDRLLPPTRFVAAHGVGNRGTRGDYGPEHVIGYLAIHALRPHGKPLTIVDTALSLAAGHDYMTWMTHLLREWTAEQGRPAMSWTEGMEWLRAHPIPEERLRQGPPRPDPIRIRLNTQTLQRLIPIARAQVWSHEDLDVFLERTYPLNEKEHRAALADVLGLFAIWAAVAQSETGHPVSWQDIEWKNQDAHAITNTWRLSKSAWHA